MYVSGGDEHGDNMEPDKVIVRETILVIEAKSSLKAMGNVLRSSPEMSSQSEGGENREEQTDHRALVGLVRCSDFIEVC